MSSEIVKSHQPCPDCGSSDALAYYPENTYCFSCKAHRHLKSTGEIDHSIPLTYIEKGTFKPMATVQQQFNSDRLNFSPIIDRKIDVDTCRKYGVKQGTANGKACHVYPYYDKDTKEHIVNKIRIVDTKEFFSEGEKHKKTGLFGQHLFSEGGKFITITEGELDCLAAYQMMGSKWPVISVRNGAASALNEIKYNLDYLGSFQHVVLCFDNDEPGIKATREIANLLEPGRCKIMHLSKKDACEYLMHGQTQKFVQDFWNARTYTPEGILCGPDIEKILFSEEKIESYPYPWDSLNSMTYGMRRGELVLVTAGSGIGKSSVMRELAHYLMKTANEKVGCLFLEEPVRKTSDGILSIEANKKFHIPASEQNVWTQEDRKQAYEDMNRLENAVFWNHFGSTSLDNLLSRIRYMAKGLDCKYIILDHISIVVYDLGDERKAIDTAMLKLRTLVQELNIHLMVVCHLSRPSGTGHEEGASVSLKELRGSHSLAQLPDMIFALERNNQAVSEQERSRTLIRILKNRFSGETGPVTMLLWNKNNGRLTEVPIDDSSISENVDGLGELHDDREFD
jgi:twinkle protein